MKRKATVPVRGQPYASELTAAAARGGEGSLHTSLLGGGRGRGIVERNLLSQFKGDAKLQVADDLLPEPSLALSLRVGAEEEPEPQNRLPYAPTRHSPSLVPAGSSVPVPSQTYAPPTGAGLAPPPQLGSKYAPTRHSPSLLPAGSSVPVPVPPQTYAPPPQLGSKYAPTRRSPSLLPAGSSMPVPPQTYAPPAGTELPPQPGINSSVELSLGVRATTLERGWGACIYDNLVADLLKKVSEYLDHRLGLLRQELSAEVTKEVLRLLAVVTGVSVPAAALSAAGSPQPCGGAWPRCPACGARPATVGLKPYEHLCLCAQCSADASRGCLVCSFTCADAAASRGRGRGPGRGRQGSLPPLPRDRPF